MRPFIAACAALAIALAGPAAAPLAAQVEVVPSPAPRAACVNTPARTLSAARPVMPDAAIRAGVSGEVVVGLQLDANSRLLSAAIVQSPSPLLDNAALTAARESTFQAATRDCVSVPGSYNFVVLFSGAGDDRGGHTAPEAMAYFRGTWSCTTAAGSIAVTVFGYGSARASYVSSDPFIDAQGMVHFVNQQFTAENGRISMIERGMFAFAGSSPGWSGNTLTFDGILTTGAITTPQQIIFERSDAAHYAQTIAEPGAAGTAPVVASRSQCVRIAALPVPAPN